MANEVLLLGYWPSPYATRCRIALAEKGVRYEYREEDFGNKSELLLKMNPVHKKIPVLIHDGRPVCESTAIVEYIDEVWKEDKAPLLPSDPYQRARARFWADFMDKKIYWHGAIYAPKGEEEQHEASKREFIDNLKILEDQVLGDNPYLGGEHFGFLDIILISRYTWFHACETYGNFKLDELCPKLMSWAKRCLEKETVSGSIPPQRKVTDYVAEKRKRLLGIQL